MFLLVPTEESQSIILNCDLFYCNPCLLQPTSDHAYGSYVLLGYSRLEAIFLSFCVTENTLVQQTVFYVVKISVQTHALV